MKTKVITKVLIITLMLVIVCCPTAYCNVSGTVRMKIDNSAPWTNINVSESYEECLSLNSTTSTLGTSALEAHLTTDYDWSIAAIFSVSQYKSGNNSGVKELGTNYTQTTGLLNNSHSTSSLFVYGLYDNDGNPKKYVNKIDALTGMNQDGKVCVSFVQNGGTKGWLSSSSVTQNSGNCVSIKSGSFGLYFGGIDDRQGGNGSPNSKTTFRPVIWN